MPNYTKAKTEDVKTRRQSKASQKEHRCYLKLDGNLLNRKMEAKKRGREMYFKKH